MAKEITDETWTTRCNLITEYLNNNDVGGASAGLQWAMDAGKADKTIRPTLWQTIYSTCKLLPNNPLGHQVNTTSRCVDCNKSTTAKSVRCVHDYGNFRAALW